MKVDFTYTNGRVLTMNRREAEILRKLKRGTYETKDMVPVAAPAPVVVTEEVAEPPKKRGRPRKVKDEE